MSTQSAGLWRNSDFVKLWVAQTVSLLGSHVSFLALPLIAASSLNATPVQMGVLTTVSTLPALLLGLFAGVWVDRHRRRPILIATDIGQAVLLIVLSGSVVLNVLRMEYLYVLAFGIAAFRLFFDVANQSLLPTLIGRDQLVEGNGKLEMSRSAVAIVGPGVAGGLIQLVTAPLAILFDAVSFLVSALGIASISVSEATAGIPQHQQTMRHAISAGVRLVLGNRSLRALTGALATLSLFTSMLDAVLLLYLTRELRLTPALIGLAFACGSVGFLLGALLQQRATRHFGLNATLIIGVLLTGFGDLLIATGTGTTSTTMIVLVLFVAQFCYGLGQATFRISQISLRQSITPDDMQGRMNATTRFVTAGLIALGGLLGGVLGAAIGLQWTLVVAAVGELLAVAWLLVPLEPLEPLTSTAVAVE
jgi:MFS family permease